MLAGSDVDVLLLRIELVSQRGRDGHALVCPRVPRSCPLELLRPEAHPDVVRRSGRYRANDRQSEGLGVVAAYWGVKAVAQREIPIGERVTEPDWLHEQI